MIGVWQKMKFRHCWRPLCSVLGQFLELLLSSVMFTDLLGSDVFCIEVLLVPVLNDCLRFENLSKRVFDCLGTVLAWGILGVVVTDPAGSDSTEFWSKVPSGSLSSCNSIGGSDSWAENAVNMILWVHNILRVDLDLSCLVFFVFESCCDFDYFGR